MSRTRRASSFRYEAQASNQPILLWKAGRRTGIHRRSIALLSGVGSVTPERLFGPARRFGPSKRVPPKNKLTMSNRSAVLTQPRPAKGTHHRAESARARTRKADAPAPGRWQFFNAFLREPLKVGSFWPSSPALAEKIVNGCDLPSRKMVVELGPGTGAFTSLILDRMNKRSRFFAVELNQMNVQQLRRRFPSLQIGRAHV